MDEINTQQIVSLIRDIMESIDNTATGNPLLITQLSHELLMVEFGEKKFRIFVQEINRFN